MLYYGSTTCLEGHTARLHPFDASAEWDLAAQFLEPVTTNTGMSEIYVLLPPF